LKSTLDPLSTVTASTISNRVDHWNTDIRHIDYYEQRYWMDDSFWTDPTTGPVFIYLCGEGECSAPSTTGYWAMVAAEHNALLVTLEHRYYGASQPFDDWTTKHLEYLTSQ